MMYVPAKELTTLTADVTWITLTKGEWSLEESSVQRMRARWLLSGETDSPVSTGDCL